ncbi:hypothetical protein [Streptomyces sp. NPDC058757]|uniref:hypothetical protein n=1 Tax=Streptomyces sp. NPDC058757 TaxID=3346626 RepID=UPI0036C8F682
MTGSEAVKLSAEERARIPESDGSAAGAARADAAVARIFCQQQRRKAVQDEALFENTQEHRDAFMDGCVDGATPFVGKMSRSKYEGAALP